jgi:hypothetical protein
VARFAVVRVRAGASVQCKRPRYSCAADYAIKPPLMYPSHVIEELVQAGAVAIHSVIVVITTKLGIQQLHLFSDATMTVLPAPLSYAFQ